MSAIPLSSWSRERTHLLGAEHKIRLALVACLALYLTAHPELVLRPAPVAGALLLMLAGALVFVAGIRTHRLAAALGFETAAAVITVLDLLNITLLVAGTGGAASGFYLLYPLPLVFAAAFFRGSELGFLTGLGGLFYGLVFMVSPDAQWAPLALRLTGIFLIVWQAYALAGVLHREKQGNDQLLRHLTEGVIVLDDEGRVVLVNHALASMFGVSAAALEGATAEVAAADSRVLAWVLHDCRGPSRSPQRTTRTEQFPEEDLPLLEVTTISCHERGTHKGGWVVVCRDLRDAAGGLPQAAEESCDDVSPLANLRALSHTLYAMAERLDDSERWRAVSLIEQHTVAMQAILTRLLQQGGEALPSDLEGDQVSVCGLLNSTRRVLEIRDQQVQVNVEVDCPGGVPDLQVARGPLGRLVLRMARGLLRFARPLDFLVLSARPEDDRVILGVELCPPPRDVVANPVLEHVDHRIEQRLRQSMEDLSRLLVQCGAVWTLRRTNGDYFRLEASLPLNASHAAVAPSVPGFEQPALLPGLEFLTETTMNRLNNLLGVIRGRAELALIWPQQDDAENVLIATIEKADEASEVLEAIASGSETASPQPAPTAAGGAAGGRPEQFAPCGLPVLIVDDDAGVRELLSAMFSSCGCQTAEAADAQQAIDYLQDQKPGLAIVDLYMPGAHGTEVLRTARQIYPDVPVVMMSGGASTSVGDALAEHRPDAVLAKPFSLHEVVGLARQVQAAV